MTNTQLYLRWLLAGIIVLALVTVPFALANRLGFGSAPVKVVAAENFWGNIASQIGGNRVSVVSIISDPNADPHLYESDANDAARVAVADVIITNGLGYDDFMSKLLSASSNSHRQVLNASQILGISGADANPHLWYDIPDVPLVARQIEQAYVAKDPSHLAYYSDNLTKFIDSLAPINQTMATIKQKDNGAWVAYTEPLPGYMLTAAGLDVRTPETFARAIEDGNDPSPADTVTMQNLITSHAIRVLLYNVQTVSPVTQNLQNLARQNSIPVVGVSETLPPGESYQAWQVGQAKQLLNALGS